MTNEIILDAASSDEVIALLRRKAVAVKEINAKLRAMNVMNSDVGALAEHLTLKALGGTLAPNSCKSYDIVLDNGETVQVKARSLSASWRRPGDFFAFDFDWFVFVVVDDEYNVVMARKVHASHLKQQCYPRTQGRTGYVLTWGKELEALSEDITHLYP